MSPLEMSREAETMEMEAWQDMMAAMPSGVAGTLQADCRMVGGAFAISARALPLATFNRAMGLGLDAPADAGAVGALAEHLRQVAAPVVQVQVAPFARPADLDRLLGKAGLRRAPVAWAKMGRTTAAPPRPATELAVEEAMPETAGEFAGAVVQGFGMPPFFADWLRALVGRERWRCYVARQGAAPVAGGAMYLGRDSAWLGVAATVASGRRLGAQGALIARRISDAAAAGKALAFTETGMLDGPNPSLANMYRSGFSLLHERANYVFA